MPATQGLDLNFREQLFYYRLFYKHLDSSHQLDQPSRSLVILIETKPKLHWYIRELPQDTARGRAAAFPSLHQDTVIVELSCDPEVVFSLNHSGNHKKSYPGKASLEAAATMNISDAPNSFNNSYDAIELHHRALPPCAGRQRWDIEGHYCKASLPFRHAENPALWKDQL